jgi:hypothetical protein
LHRSWLKRWGTALSQGLVEPVELSQIQRAQIISFLAAGIEFKRPIQGREKFFALRVRSQAFG